jgi:uncharacterized protein (TIGR03086 family)
MEPNEVIERARQEFDRRLQAVPADAWARATPCPDWNVRQLVNHVVGGNAMAAVMLRGGTADDALTVFSADTLGDDPLAAYRASADDQDAAFAEPGAMERTVAHPLVGDMPASQLFGFRVADLTLHAWDLARAVDGDEHLDDELVEVVWAGLSPLAPALPSTGMFGEGSSGSVADDSSTQAKLLDATGRRP